MLLECLEANIYGYNSYRVRVVIEWSCGLLGSKSIRGVESYRITRYWLHKVHTHKAYYL